MIGTDIKVNHMENYVVGIGEILWDMLPAGKQLGGAPANFAYHVKQLGLPVKVVSAVGNDSLGHEIMDVFQVKEIPALVSKVDYQTGIVQVSLDEAGVPSYEIKTDVAWDYIPYNSELEELAHHTKVVCFGSLAQRNAVSRAAIYRFLDAMPQNDEVLKVFDINLRQNFYTREIIHESLSKANILKINDEELAIISELFDLKGDTVDEQCKQLLATYELKMVILTCGENGSYVVTPTQTLYRETPKVEVVDTVGAGDAFAAAFIAGLLKGMTLAEAHRLAVNISAYVCTKPGAMPQMPYISILE